jgi:hypothetical protein
MIRTLCLWASKHLPSITIPTPQGKPYLTRYYLFGADRKFGNIFLHHFHSSDLDVSDNGTYLLHNHPFWGLSLILVGGYIEERRQPDDTITKKKFLPWSFNLVKHETFHRVELLQQDGWSLFITGSRTDERSWGFWDRITKKYYDYRQFSKAIA